MGSKSAVRENQLFDVYIDLPALMKVSIKYMGGIAIPEDKLMDCSIRVVL